MSESIANRLGREDIPIRQIKKNTILQRKGDNYPKAYFVKTGILRSYTIDAKGKEHVFMFAPEGWIVGDFVSYAFNQPTNLFVDAIEDSTIEVIGEKGFDPINLPQDYLSEQMSSMLRRAAVLQRRILMLMSSSATERYEHFLETYPDITNRVPQRMIASYLGITPEALSKIRGEMARGTNQ